MTDRSLASIFAGFAHGLRSEDIPRDVHLIAHRAMLDTLGVILAGASHSDVQTVASVWAQHEGLCGLTIGGNSTAETAALVNGCAAHVWDFDDTSYTGIMHGSAIVFPVVLALAQETGASETDLLTAFVVGSEISYVLADICTHQHYFNGWWSTVTFGLIGATAAAAKLLGCDPDQTAQAINLAAAGAGGGKSVFGTSAKPFLVGETAQRAVKFARFAANGLTGPADSFAGKPGFLHLLNNDISQMSQVETLGRRWRLLDPGLLIKRYPVCSAAQAAIEEMARLTFEAEISAGDIAEIQLEIPHLVRISLVHDDPKTPAQAQFSLPFAIACAALNGAVRLADISPASLQDPDVQDIMRKTRISVAEDLSSEDMRQKFPECARIKVLLTDGSQRQGFCAEAYGMPGRPLSDADFNQKFQDCLSFANKAHIESDIQKDNILDLAAKLFDPSKLPTNVHTLQTGGA